jgi:PIN domain nuclease of toxin-antitoxin system
VNLLLDTHLMIWAAEGIERVPVGARDLMEASDNDLHFSVASLWEIAIKRGLHRKDFQLDARVLRRGLIDNGYHELAIAGQHAVAIDMLPPIHKDPFDRLLIAQATVEGITLLTDDATVAKYPGPIRLV